jgi:hypothetical protein
MSLVSMVDTHLANQQGKGGGPGSPSKPVGVSTNLVNQITRWIPTETITVYVALLALVAPISAHANSHSYMSRWVLFAIVTAVNPVVVYLIYMGKRRSNSDLKALPSPVFAMIIAPVAFAAWAFALPDTPLSSISGYGIQWNTGIITVATSAIWLVAYALGQSPNYDQVQTQQQGASVASPTPPVA